MQIQDLRAVLRDNTYPGRGIVLGKSADGQKAVIAYFIMGRSENSRNRIFVEEDLLACAQVWCGHNRYQRRSDRYDL